MKSETDPPPTAQSQSSTAEPTWSSRLSRIRHDLRNPLSEILGFSEILQEEAAERGLQQLLPGFGLIHQAASRIFGEVNHWLNPDTIRMTPESFHELERTVQSLSQRIISNAENLSEKCDELENNWVGDDLLRIEGAARKLQDLAPPLLQQLADAFARSKRPPQADSATLASGEALTEATFIREPESDAGAASGALLIVDDDEANRALLARRFRRQGFTVSLAENGRQALEKLRGRRFDLVLLDVIMPEMGGYPVLEKIKQDPELRHIPVIMISALDDLEMLTRCIQKGAEDYLAKPFDPVLLRARIGSCLEKKRLHDQEQRTYRALVESQQHLAGELAEAAAYVTSLLPAPMAGDVTADWRFIPSSQLGGDAFGYHWPDPEHFAVYLLDVCSHGVGAALLSISVMNVLRSQSLPDADFRNPGEVLSSLNRTFPMERHNNLYFTMWYGVFNRPARQLSYASGGHPPAILISGPDQAGAHVEPLKTPGTPIGAFPDCAYPNRRIALNDFNRLFVFSDGAYEIVRPDGSMLSLEEFTNHLLDRTRSGTSGPDATLAFLEKMRGSASYEDDLALVEIGFPATSRV